MTATTTPIVEFLNRFAAALEITTAVDVEMSPDGPRLNLSGEEAELLVRHRGEPLKALQLVVDMAFGRSLADDQRVFIDALSYRKGKDIELRRTAKYLAEKARDTGVDQQLGPLNPYERRLVHLAAAEVPGVTTESVGDAFSKTVPHLPAEVAAPGAASARELRRLRAAGQNDPKVFSTVDTIVAIATPPGRGGIGVVRLSGSSAHTIGRALIGRTTPLTPRHATLATIVRTPQPVHEDHARPTVSEAIDQAIVTYFPAPHSYTGDDVVEISAHGSPVVLKAIVAAAIDCGARVAAPGEFTLRAFVNGRVDLMQAEAVADLIDAATPLQAQAAFDQLNGTLTDTIATIDAALFDLIARLEASVDFPEEGYHFVQPGELAASIDGIIAATAALLQDGRRGRLLREGLQVAILGKPNVGKSSVFNRLVGASRAIVTEIPGTTRDMVSETIDLGGLRVTVIDTAGLRETSDIVESEGVARSRRAAETADAVLIICDASQPLDSDDEEIIQTTVRKRVIVANKCDMQRAWTREDAVEISAVTGAGLDALRAHIFGALDIELLGERPGITNIRHLALVERADAALRRARTAALADGVSLSEEFVLADLQEARQALEEVTGKRSSEDVLAHIFDRFCIGK